MDDHGCCPTVFEFHGKPFIVDRHEAAFGTQVVDIFIRRSPVEFRSTQQMVDFELAHTNQLPTFKQIADHAKTN